MQKRGPEKKIKPDGLLGESLPASSGFVFFAKSYRRVVTTCGEPSLHPSSHPAIISQIRFFVLWRWRWRLVWLCLSSILSESLTERKEGMDMCVCVCGYMFVGQLNSLICVLLYFLLSYTLICRILLLLPQKPFSNPRTCRSGHHWGVWPTCR